MTAKTDPSTGNADMRRRRRLLRRLRRVVRVIEEQHRIQDIGYGLLVAALAMASPSAAPYTGGDEAARRLDGEAEVLTQGLLYPLASGLLEVVDGIDGATAIRMLAALCLGAAFMLTLALLRGLGFRRTASLPATIAAFAVPYSWNGATSPIDYAPGMLGASLLLWSLFRQPQSSRRGYQWRAIICFGAAYMLHMELVLLIPATAWAVARHPDYQREAQVTALSVVAVLAMSISIGLAGPSESMRVDHLVTRVLAGANGPSPEAWLKWLIAAPIGFGASLFGIYQLILAQRSAEAQRAPVWIVAWCLPFLAPIVAGSPEFQPISPYLIPAGALGIAEWLNRQGSARLEARLGTGMVLAQIALTAAVLLLR
jgi:hypothetical protein